MAFGGGFVEKKMWGGMEEGIWLRKTKVTNPKSHTHEAQNPYYEAMKFM